MKSWKLLTGIATISLFLAYLAISVTIKPGQAAFFPTSTQNYQCQTAHITLSPNGEDPSCPNGTSTTASHYTSSVKVTVTGTGHYKLYWGAAAYWCKNPQAQSCHEVLSGSAANSMDLDLSTGSKSVTIPVTARSGFNGQACGTFQSDFGMYLADTKGNRITSAGCPIAFSGNVSSLWSSNNMAAWCNTRNVCTTPTIPPTAMPTTKPTNTPTPTNIPTPTNKPTSTPIPTQSITPTITPTGTPTPTKGIIPTPTQGITPTATPTQGITPTLAITPTPTAEITPSPTSEVTPTSISSVTNNNNNNNSNTQSQSQSQTQSQTVSVSLAESVVPSPTVTQQVLGSSTTPSQLPSTGVPFENLALLIGLLPAGLTLRKWSK